VYGRGKGGGQPRRQPEGGTTFMIIFETRVFGEKTISFDSSSSSGS
jgi:hypothetical protein